mmetsp:Transcript_712/g.872  ORF Transcript_712/g.872 Transcript_712/m.872 type:complete len:695 (+) Transcript_712:226-2310(+)
MAIAIPFRTVLLTLVTLELITLFLLSFETDGFSRLTQRPLRALLRSSEGGIEIESFTTNRTLRWMSEHAAPLMGLFDINVRIGDEDVVVFFPESLKTVNSDVSFGVLSRGHNKEMRDSVRETWGMDINGKKRPVFFLMTLDDGMWPIEEALIERDLILIDMPPVNNTKVLSYIWFFLSFKFSLKAKYFVKTEDNVFVDVAGLQDELRQKNYLLTGSAQIKLKSIDGWGSCNSKATNQDAIMKCDSRGYALSRKVLECLLNRPDSNLLEAAFDSGEFISFIATKCNIQVQNSPNAVSNVLYVYHTNVKFYLVRLFYADLSISQMHLYDLIYRDGKMKWKITTGLRRFRSGFYHSYIEKNDNYLEQFASHKPSRSWYRLWYEYPFPRPLGQRIHLVRATVTISGMQVTYWFPEQLEGLASDVAIGVLSSPGNANRRNTIRRTWALNSEFRKQKNVFFLVGKENGRWPVEEALVHSDVILIDIREAYNENSFSSLPYKSQVLFHLVQTQTKSSFLLKTDDDAFIDIDGLTRQMWHYKSKMKGPGSADLYWGNCLPEHHQLVIRDNTSKWFVPESMYEKKTYPPYCIGGGYVISNGPGLKCMVQQLESFKHITLEDTATGMLARKCGISPYDHFNKMVYDITSESDLHYMRLIYHKLSRDKIWQYNALYKLGGKKWEVRGKIRRFRDGILSKYVEVTL